MMQLEGVKIVTSKEMAQVERKSIEEGASAEKYMCKAGEGIAAQIKQYICNAGCEKQITLLVGKGNNGGDAYVAGVSLLKDGYSVKALCLYDVKDSSLLNRKYREVFLQSGGKIETFKVKQDFLPYSKGVIVDGLLGTGFEGEVTGALKELIEAANAAKLPILSIDIPSGLNGNTGEVKGSAILAKETYFLSLPKVGFFINQGYEYVGMLKRIDFGMEESYIKEARAFGFLFSEEKVKELLPKIQRTRHKYQRGYVLALAGSKGMPGAALLACLATLRSGAGIVRLFHPIGMEEELSGCFEELIKTPWSLQEDGKIFEEVKRADSFLIGPGIGHSQEVKQLVLKILSHTQLPCILDADALAIFAAKATQYPSSLVLTPHRGEMLTCLGLEKMPSDEILLALCQSFVEEKKVTLILKGAPTYVFHPEKPFLVIPRGDPGMATAGAGDVLSGIVAALLAQGLEAREAAAVGVYLHALAGEIAAKQKTSYAMIASDLIEALPEVFHHVEKQDAV
jgi:NAD(P)H-hydrate epimerase